MFSFALLFTLLVLGFAAAQNTTSSFNAAAIDPTTRSQWCNAQKNTCGTLCGGRSYTKNNNCDPTTLTFDCTCANGQTPPNLSQYSQTLPFLECQATFKQCNTANPGSSSCSNQCGSLDPSSVKPGAGAASTSKAAASTSASATESSTETSAPATRSSGAAMRYVPEAGFAAAVVGAVGVLL